MTTASTRRPWTEAEFDYVLDRGDRDSYAEMAVALGRTVTAVRAYAVKHRLGPTRQAYRPFTAAESAAIRRRYPAEGATRLAAEFGREPGAVVSRACRMGVHFLRPWTPEDDRAMRRLYGHVGVAEIARGLGRSHDAVSSRAKSLGLTVPNHDPQTRLAELLPIRAAGTRPIDVRWAKARLAVGDHGWPPDLLPGEVAVLNALWERGPMTRAALSEAVGEPADRPAKSRLMAHGRRSRLARLMARGLVIRLWQHTGGRQRCALYCLPLNAAELRGRWDSNRQHNGDSQ